MAFKEVFAALQEMFPQVDPRILRAVAFEHANNTDEAIDSVYIEILPNMKSPETSYTEDVVHQVPDPSGKEAVQRQNGIAENENDSHHAIAEHMVDSSESVSVSICQNVENCPSGLSVQADAVPEQINYISGITKNNLDGCGCQVSYCSFEPSESQDSLNVGTTADTFAAVSPSPETLDGSYATSSAIEVEVLSIYDKTPAVPTTTSDSFVSSEFLEDIITNAKSSKNDLLSSVESVTSLNTNVHLIEERAKQAKEEALRAGQDIFSKVAENKQILNRAKEANNTHAGEVNGEKSILATESRELLSRVLILSEERDKSLSIIEEIRKTLESRLAAAEEQIAMAEQEKLEKEALALKVLSEQDRAMEYIVEESRILQAAAAKNSKLREFLMESGRIVDNLQGEIAVICEDIMLLKERVDGRLPLRASWLSVSSSLSSSLSSSSYRSRSLPDVVSQDGSSKDSPVLKQKQQHELQQYSESNSRDKAYIGNKSGDFEDYLDPFEEDYYQVLTGAQV